GNRPRGRGPIRRPAYFRFVPVRLDSIHDLAVPAQPGPADGRSATSQEKHMDIDQAKLDALLGRMVGEIGAAASAPLVMLGDRLGLYKAMAGAGPLTA